MITAKRHRQHIVIETPRGQFVKYNEAGKVDFYSPIPSPFNYGHLQGLMGGDGDPLDGLLLGPSVSRGLVIEAEVIGVVRFLDKGEVDDKWILSISGDISQRQKYMIRLFFHFYAQMKKLLAFRLISGKISRVIRIEYF